MSIYSVVPCDEVHGTRQEEASITGSPVASVDLRCAYANKYILVADLLNSRRPWPFAVGLHVPTASHCVIKDEAGAFLQDGQTCVFETSIISVSYSTETTDLFSEELEGTAEFQLRDHKLFTWDDGKNTPLQQGEAPGFLRRGLSLNRTLFSVPEPLPIELLSLQGCVNDSIIVNSMGLTFGTEQLLYTPPKTSRTIKTDGTGAWQITLKFIYKKEGWNTYWNAAQQQFMRIRNKAIPWGDSLPPAQLDYSYPLGPLWFFFS